MVGRNPAQSTRDEAGPVGGEQNVMLFEKSTENKFEIWNGAMSSA